MATYTKFNCFVEDLAEKVHNLGSDQLKVALTNDAPVATNTVVANLNQISYTNLSGATPLNISLDNTGGAGTGSQQTSGTYKLKLTDVVLTATGSVGPFRYITIYNDTASGDPLIAFYDYGSSITLASGETFTIDFDGTNGFLQLA
jgi:hypothetical protein